MLRQKHIRKNRYTTKYIYIYIHCITNMYLIYDILYMSSSVPILFLLHGILSDLS